MLQKGYFLIFVIKQYNNNNNVVREAAKINNSAR